MLEQPLSPTQKAILESAKAHFLAEGFQKASLNQIVKDAGFTKGAFYGHYRSKEDLFCTLVGETAEGIQDILSQVISSFRFYPPEERSFHMGEAFLRFLPELVDFVFNHKEEVVLLLSKAEGTRYEDFLENLQRKDEEEGQNNLKSTFVSLPIPKDTYRLLMQGYFYSLRSIFLSERSKGETISAITDIQAVFEYGILSLAKSKTAKKPSENKN